ncbi:unnamed protein product, partial [Discosporangium mesarthrocarpum]
TEVEVVLVIPDDGVKSLGVTLARNPREDKIFVKAFPKKEHGNPGLLESTGLVEIGDSLTAINGISIDQSDLSSTMDTLRSSPSPMTLRFLRPGPPTRANAASTIGDSRGGGYVAGSVVAADLDAVINSRIVLSLGERIARIQHNNTRLLANATRMSAAMAAKRIEVGKTVGALSSLLDGAAFQLRGAQRVLKEARRDAEHLCAILVKVDRMLTIREQAREAK